MEAIETYTSFLKKDLKNTRVSGVSFCHGVSGNMHILHKMLRKEGVHLHPYKLKIHEYINSLINSYNPENPFGFTDNENKTMHKPGLLEGSAGICLTILEVIHTVDLKWDSPFLLF